MNTHPMPRGLPRLLPTLAATTALLMLTTVLAAPVAADNHFRPLEAWNNFFQGSTDGLFVRWSEPVGPNPPGPPSGYTIHEAADCSDEAISTGAVNNWAPGRPAIRDLIMSGWDNVVEGETYYLHVAEGTEASGSDGTLNQEECIEFVAELRAAITGWVTDASTGDRLGTATVSAFDADGNLAGQQDVVSFSPNPGQIGNYSIEGLEPGTYTVTADAPGYLPETQTITAAAGQTPNVAFNLQPEAQEEPGAIAGTVTDDGTGDPLAGATVTADGESATTGADGSYTIADLDAGDYTVTASAAGYEEASQAATVTAGQTTTGVDFALTETVVTDPGAVAGTVTDADTTDPIEGATVTAGGQAATTGADGSYLIEDVEAGDQTVTATAAGYQEASQSVTVTGGETVGADFALQPAVTDRCGEVVTGDLTLTEDIGPCEDGGLFVEASGTEGDPLVIDLGGHTLFGVTDTPGNGAGILIAGQEHVVVRNGTIREFDAGVAVDGGQRNHLEDLLIENNRGSGATTWGEGVAFWESDHNTICNSVLRNNGPYAGVGVYGAGTTGNVVGDPACGAGSLPGVNEAGVGGNLITGNSLQVGATNQTDGVRLEPVTDTTTVVNNTVEGSGLDGIAIFSRSTDNVVRGNISRDNGAHAAIHRLGNGVIAFAGSARNVIEDNIITGNAANGIFLQGQAGTQPTGSIDNQVLDNMVVGNAALQDQRPETSFYDLHDANFDPPCDNNTWLGNVFETFNQECVTTGGTQLPAITGQVTDASTGEPIAGATVTAEAADGTESSTTTDDEGMYLFQDVAPGDYTVSADAEGYEPASQNATVAEGEMTTVDFALESDEVVEPEPTDPATKDDCKSGGWEDYGFRNQGQCIQFVNTDKDSRP